MGALDIQPFVTIDTTLLTVGCTHRIFTSSAIELNTERETTMSFTILNTSNRQPAITGTLNQTTESDLKASTFATQVESEQTREHWTDVTIRDVDGRVIPMGDNAERRQLMARYRRNGSLLGYYLGDDDTDAEGYDGSTAGPSVDEIDWAGL